MSVEIKVPALGESVSEAIVAQWLKKPGEAVNQDETIAELETDKVTLEVNAPSSGVISEIKAEEGATVEVGALLGMIDTDGKAAAPAPAEKEAPKTVAPAPQQTNEAADTSSADEVSPAVRKILEENSLSANQITGTGKGGRLTKGDVIDFLEKGSSTPAANHAATPAPVGERTEERVRMSKLRQTIAGRLKDAQNNAAILTTFNDVDMTGVMETRNRYKADFEKQHGVRLGFMSFFVKAAVQALQAFPAVNAEIDGTDTVYKKYYDIGVAVGTAQGLVVPVIRDADKLSFAEIEAKIADFGARARDGKLSMDELTGGTFTISNGGVYGSLMSTPILNPPQSAILGMHRIEKRPVVVDDQVVVRPMMYLAMSYDHRIIDGTESVRFLKTIKEAIEDPQRLLLF